MKRVKVFSDRYPFLGPLIWILTVQYFIVQIIVASAWHSPPYSWLHNTISDLGNTVCSDLGSRIVCSPLHALMNVSFVSLGVLMALGSLLIYQEFCEKSGTLIGFTLMAIAGLGTLLVGVFPENTVPSAHLLGASMPFILGNLSLLILGFSLYDVSGIFRGYTLLSGLVALITLPFFISHHYGALGIGGTERFVAYPQTLWLIFFGLYMSRNHYRHSRPK